VKTYEVLFLSGSVFCIAAVLGISAIGLRNSTWFGTYKSPLSKLGPVDIKIAKVSAVLFSIGAVLFIIGFMFM
jgi:hypothetical protein